MSELRQVFIFLLLIDCWLMLRDCMEPACRSVRKMNSFSRFAGTQVICEVYDHDLASDPENDLSVLQSIICSSQAKGVRPDFGCTDY